MTIQPWRQDVVFGAVRQPDALKITIRADKPWKGKLIFDAPRHKTVMKMPIDWPRINQFPEWFTAPAEKRYQFLDLTANTHKGIQITLIPNTEKHLLIK